MKKSGKHTAPQIFRDDTYLGDYDAFLDAIENESLEKWLGIFTL